MTDQIISQTDWRERSVQDGLMTKDPICLTRNHTAGDALMILDALQVNHIPITENGESNGKLVGIVSSRGVAHQLSNELSSANKPIGDWMLHLDYDFSSKETRDIWHILSLSSTWKDAMHFLSKEVSVHISGSYINTFLSALLVVDEKDFHLQGIISFVDLIKKMSPKQDTAWRIPLHNLSVNSTMFKDIEKIDFAKPDDSFTNVVNVLVDKHHRRTIPVIAGTKAIGLIRDTTVFSLRNEIAKSGEFDIKANDPRLMEDARFLKLLTPEQKIHDIVDSFLDKTGHPDAMIVVDDAQERNFKGILSYIDIFRALLSNSSPIIAKEK